MDTGWGVRAIDRQYRDRQASRRLETDARSRTGSVEGEGDRLADLHVWRFGPGHLGAIVSVVTEQPRDPGFYRESLARFGAPSHLTVEIDRAA